MRDIFEFNHIDQTLSTEKVKILKDLYAYYTYFSTVPSNWDMSCITEWLRIPQPISVDSEIPSKPESNE